MRWHEGGNSLVGCAALRPVLELLPTPALVVKRQFTIGKTNVSFCANLEVKASLITAISINNTLQVFHTCVCTRRANSKPMYKVQLFLASCMSSHSNIFFSKSAIGVMVSERILRCWFVMQMLSAKGATWSLQFNWRKDAVRILANTIWCLNEGPLLEWLWFNFWQVLCWTGKAGCGTC